MEKLLQETFADLRLTARQQSVFEEVVCRTSVSVAGAKKEWRFILSVNILFHTVRLHC